MTLKLNGSSSGYTAIDAPAAAGSNTLVLPTGNGSAGQVLKNSSTAGTLEFGDAGIANIDAWKMTADMSAGDGTIDSNLVRHTTGLTSVPLGTGMSVSSGVWTFPATGWWRIDANVVAKIPANTASNYSYLKIQTTPDNSTYSTSFEGYGHSAEINSTHFSGITAVAVLDITDTSNHKVKFVMEYENNNVQTAGTSPEAQTYFIFTRLAGT